MKTNSSKTRDNAIAFEWIGFYKKGIKLGNTHIVWGLIKLTPWGKSVFLMPRQQSNDIRINCLLNYTKVPSTWWATIF